jgi:hypothetical protein
MTDEATHVDYTAMFTPESVEEISIDEVIEESIVETPIEELVPDPINKFVAVNLDEGAKLRFRIEPMIESNVISSLSTGVVLQVVNDEDPNWLFVEVCNDSEHIRGYVNRQFVIETTAPVV